MIKKIFITIFIATILSAAISSADQEFIIWDPCDSPSADSLVRILQAEGYRGLQIPDIIPYMETLENYKPLFVVADTWSDNISWELLDDIKYDILDYLEDDGSIYWEGINTAFFHDFYRDDIFDFDIATCITHPFDILTGCYDGPFEINLSTVTSHAQGIGGGNGSAFCAPDICPDKAVFRISPFKTMICSFEIACLTDDGENDRRDFAHLIMGWLTSPVAIGDIDEAPISEYYMILQNYPNPFNSYTTITYALPVESHVHIEVYDLTGRRIEILVDEIRRAGYHRTIWNATDKASGIYFARAKTSHKSDTIKLLYLK